MQESQVIEHNTDQSKEEACTRHAPDARFNIASSGVAWKRSLLCLKRCCYTSRNKEQNIFFNFHWIPVYFYFLDLSLAFWSLEPFDRAFDRVVLAVPCTALLLINLYFLDYTIDCVTFNKNIQIALRTKIQATENFSEWSEIHWHSRFAWASHSKQFPYIIMNSLQMHFCRFIKCLKEKDLHNGWHWEAS